MVLYPPIAIGLLLNMIDLGLGAKVLILGYNTNSQNAKTIKKYGLLKPFRLGKASS